MALTLLNQTFETGTAGAAVTALSSAGDGLSEVNPILGTGASNIFTTTGGEAVTGTSSRCQGPSGSTAFNQWNLPGGTLYGISGKFRLPLVTAVGAVLAVRSPTTALIQAQLRTDRKLYFLYAGGTLATSAALTLPGVYTIEMACDSGSTATDGRAKVAVRDSGGALVSMTYTNDAGSTVTAAAVATRTGVNTGAGAAVFVGQAGKVNSTTDTGVYVVDDMKMVLGAYAFPSELGSIPPTAAAGPDMTVEPWTTVTLDAAGSADPNGAPLTGYQWTQTSGPAVTLTGATLPQATFQAPAALTTQTLTFNLTVTNGSLTSLADSVTVTSLYATKRLVTASGEVPLRVMLVVPGGEVSEPTKTPGTYADTYDNTY